MKKVEPIRKVEDVEAMKEFLKKKSERDYIMFMIGIHTGLIVKDILYLKVRDVKNKDFLLGGTGSTKRQLNMPPELKRALNIYIADKKVDEYLFSSQIEGNQHIGPQRAYEIINTAAKKIGLQNIGTLSMRKTYGYFFYKQTRNLPLLKKILAQTKLVDTLDYIGWDEDVL